MFTGMPEHPAIQAAGLLLAGALGLLLAGLIASRQARPLKSGGVGTIALLWWLPAAIAAITSAFLGCSELALGVVFGTSAAVMSVVAGCAMMAGEPGQLPPHAQRVWAFLPAPALLTLLLGFRGMLGLFEAALLAAQGVLSWLVWTSAPLDMPHSPDSTSPGRARPGGRWRWWWIAAAAVLTVEAAWLAARGAESLADADPRYSPAAAGAVILALVLTAPLISAAVPAAAAGGAAPVMAAGAGFMLLNLGALLPCVICIGVVRGAAVRIAAATRPVWMELPFPCVLWRIGAPALVVLAMLFAVAAAGRIRLNRHLGMWLVVGYCLYLVTVLSLGAQ